MRPICFIQNNYFMDILISSTRELSEMVALSLFYKTFLPIVRSEVRRLENHLIIISCKNIFYHVTVDKNKLAPWGSSLQWLDYRNERKKRQRFDIFLIILVRVSTGPACCLVVAQVKFLFDFKPRVIFGHYRVKPGFANDTIIHCCYTSKCGRFSKT